MGVERCVVEAVVLEGRCRREVARSTGISRAWVDKLVDRYRKGGWDALAPRPRRPKSCAHAVPPDIQTAIVEMRHQLGDAGHDNGPHTLAHDLREHFNHVPSVARIWRILKRHGEIKPQPQKRPKSSFVRFQADLPNEMWQGDTTHWHLADDSDVEILNYLDDHSRLLTASDAFVTVKGADVVQVFYNAAQAHGFPASLLTDNGAVFTGKSRHGKVLLESELEGLGIVFKHSTPYHPQTCGKGRALPPDPQALPRQADPGPLSAPAPAAARRLRAHYNHHRPHRALNGRTPLVAFHDRLKARPAGPPPTTHFRVRKDKTDTNGTITLRYLSRLRHIPVGRAHKHQPVTLLVAGRHVRVVTEDGSLLRELTIDPARDYQPPGHTVWPP